MRLPKPAQDLADKSHALLETNPKHPSLRFKKAGKYWSARVGAHYRALAAENSGDFVWFWIGTHKEYEGLIG